MLPRELRQTLAESELRCAHAEGDEDPEMVPSRGSGFLSAGFWHCSFERQAGQARNEEPQALSENEQRLN